MKKQPKKKSRLQELDELQQELERKLFIAHTTNMSYAIIEQLNTQVELNRMNMRDEAELERYRNHGDGVTMSTDPNDRPTPEDED